MSFSNQTLLIFYYKNAMVAYLEKVRETRFFPFIFYMTIRLGRCAKCPKIYITRGTRHTSPIAVFDIDSESNLKLNFRPTTEIFALVFGKVIKNVNFPFTCKGRSPKLDKQFPFFFEFRFQSGS